MKGTTPIWNRYTLAAYPSVTALIIGGCIGNRFGKSHNNTNFKKLLVVLLRFDEGYCFSIMIPSMHSVKTDNGPIIRDITDPKQRGRDSNFTLA